MMIYFPSAGPGGAGARPVAPPDEPRSALNELNFVLGRVGFCEIGYRQKHNGGPVFVYVRTRNQTNLFVTPRKKQFGVA